MTRWLWTSRAGFERDLAEELPGGRVLAPGLAEGKALPSGAPPPTFGRQGFPVAAEVEPAAEAVLAAVVPLVGEGDYGLHVWVPDSDDGNRLSGRAGTLRSQLLEGLGPAAQRERGAHELYDPADPVIQVCLASESKAYVGAAPLGQLPSTWPGGRARMKLPAGAPSRATAKLAEALAWLGFGPEAGDVCVDLGAAPGGWSWLLVRRKARVIAVDRANLEPSLARDRRVLHVRDNAFTFRPDEPVDWLLCDMVHKPNEVAELLARWAKRKQARFLLANIKLPMKQRVAAVAAVRRTLANGGWKDIRSRQLYHDRDEITLAARR